MFWIAVILTVSVIILIVDIIVMIENNKRRNKTYEEILQEASKIIQEYGK